MATVRSPTKTWVAREGEVYLAKADEITYDGTTSLSGSFANAGVAIHAACKNLTITPPETGWEKQDFQGEDINNFQNQLVDEKPVGMATFTGTLVLAENETIEDYMVSGTVSGPAGYTRYQIGKDNTNKLAVCVVLDNGTNAVLFGFDNARVTKYGDVRIGSPDGHWEQDVTIVSLAKDFYYEFKD